MQTLGTYQRPDTPRLDADHKLNTQRLEMGQESDISRSNTNHRLGYNKTRCGLQTKYTKTRHG